MDEGAIVGSAVLTIIIVKITDAGFWQGVGVFIVMYLVVGAFIEMNRNQ